ncbi:hypothetical protein BET10_18875 [Pseudoalteromonas amylolytica]|uniref:Uncharacterized protein n=1 Tax=Pseudoalteromonas amylolytica TaxID=1859457 RepID=A0A1S1MM81_9GAMM|nr:hypothetical protein BFC16_13880 [Pseudoalteromonas sp. JW3]OHU88882.1 hypothetical protein BET10_18875 [Pseudoalteromonas amylolytica]
MGAKTLVKVDLSAYQCPQLFVQFKWHLRQAQQTDSIVQFYYHQEQDINDIVRYLKQHQYLYVHYNGAQPSIEVSINHV